jgi:hypothetical protein
VSELVIDRPAFHSAFTQGPVDNNIIITFKRGDREYTER